jgi:hypothetical protein
VTDAFEIKEYGIKEILVCVAPRIKGLATVEKERYV